MINLPELEYDFYGAVLVSILFGSRREMTLTFELWPRVGKQLSASFRQGEGVDIAVRFGGVHNFEDVKAYWESWRQNPSLHYLRYCDGKHSKPGSLFFEVEFDRTDDYTVIHCQNITVTRL